MQKVMICETRRSSLRDEISAWRFEDGDNVHTASRERGVRHTEIEIEYVLSSLDHYPRYKTVLHAISDGWRLLSPPQGEIGNFEWWLVRG